MAGVGVSFNLPVFSFAWRQERTRLVERRAVFVTIPPLLSEILAEVASEGVQLKLIAQIERDALMDQLPVLRPTSC
jgi:hypothetical protein